MPDSVFRKVSTSESVGSQSSPGYVSLGSLINTRKLTKKFTMGFFSRKKLSSTRSLNFQDIVKYEPTYRLEPTKKLPLKEINSSLKTLIHNKVAFVQYDSRKAALITQVLCDEIKNDIKSFSVERYKIVVHAILGCKTSQEVTCAGKFVWDSSSDDFLTFNYENSSIFLAISVYFLYHE